MTAEHKKASDKKAKAARANGKRGGRPRRELNEQERKYFEAMCSAGVPAEDIAEALSIDCDTLAAICKRHYGMGFSVYREQKRGKGRAALAQKQFQVAMTGNPTMLIWLGKQWLGQSDRHEVGGPGGKPIPLVAEVVFVDSPSNKQPWRS